MKFVFPRLPTRTVLRTQSGFTLTELALAFAVLGIGSVMVWQVIGLNAGDKARVKTRQALERAAYAVERFAQLHGRLPCPSPETDGIESCNSAQEGYLPYLTLGLPLKVAGSLEYKLGDGFAALVDDHLSKYEVLYAASAAAPDPTHSPLGSYPGGKIGLQDFCTELLRPSKLGALVFKVRQNSKEFEGTGEVQLKIQSSRSQLSGKIGCNTAPVGGRAYFNVLSASRMMTKSITDYVDLVDTQTNLKIHGITQSSIMFGLSGWMLARTGAYIGLALEGVEDSLGANGLAIGAGVALAPLFVSEGVSVGGQVSELARLIKYQVVWEKQLQDMKDLRDQTAALSTQIESRAVASASRILFAIP